MEKPTTTISVTKETWEELMKRKKMGESMDDTLKRIYLNVPIQDRREQQLENLKLNFPNAYEWHMEHMEGL